MFKFLILIFFAGIIPDFHHVPDANRVCGKWMSSEKNLVVQVYREEAVFKAKVVWFLSSDKNKAMEEWTDRRTQTLLSGAGRSLA
jgi:hypothetical protein